MVGDNQEQVVAYSLKLPKQLLDNFRLSVRLEGYSIQDALILLMKQYVDKAKDGK